MVEAASLVIQDYDGNMKHVAKPGAPMHAFPGLLGNSMPPPANPRPRESIIR
jgi:hypothetical protein